MERPRGAGDGKAAPYPRALCPRWQGEDSLCRGVSEAFPSFAPGPRALERAGWGRGLPWLDPAAEAPLRSPPFSVPRPAARLPGGPSAYAGLPIPPFVAPPSLNSCSVFTVHTVIHLSVCYMSPQLNYKTHKQPYALFFLSFLFFRL